MAKYSNEVVYNIKTNLDASGITKLQTELNKLKNSLNFERNMRFKEILGLSDGEIDKSIQKINQLQAVLAKAFNPKTNSLDLTKLNSQLNKEHTSLQGIVQDWNKLGSQGKVAISSLSNALLSMNKSTITLNTGLSKIATTMGNTVRWGITASLFQEMMNSVTNAVNYMKDLDESLANIQMVTQSSKEDMRELARYANEAAQVLASTTTDYTNAVKVFVQEGYSTSEAQQYANLSIKMANISEQDTATTSDQITAYRNAFQLDYEKTSEAMDKIANVANSTASNVEELMTASQRAASVAQSVGASQEQFLASIATIESVTRQSAEEIGNGLKTIYQRFADIQVSGKADDGVTYGQYASALKSVGVDVLDEFGTFKGMDRIFSELQDVWSNLNQTQQIAVGEKVAGKFQYNRFAALMNNQDYYQKAYDATQNADGMVDNMQEVYAENIEGQLNRLQTAGEQVMSSLFNQDTVEPILHDVGDLVNELNDFIDVIGGLPNILTVISSLMLKAFGPSIAGQVASVGRSISSMITGSKSQEQMAASFELFGFNAMKAEQLSATAVLGKGVASNYQYLSSNSQQKVREVSAQLLEIETEKQAVLEKEEKILATIRATGAETLLFTNEQVASYEKQQALIKNILESKSKLEIEESAILLINNQIAEATSKIDSINGQKSGMSRRGEKDTDAYKNLGDEANKYQQEIKLLKERRKILLESAFELEADIDYWKIVLEEEERSVQLTDWDKEKKVELKKNLEAILPKIKEYRENLAKGIPLTENQSKEVAEWIKQYSELGVKGKEFAGVLQEMQDISARNAMGKKLAENTVKATNLEATITKITSVLSSVTSIAFGFSMLSDVFDTLNSETATLEDKIDSLLMNGLMGLTMLLPGVVSLGKTMKKFSEEIKEAAIATELLTVAEEGHLLPSLRVLSIQLAENTALFVASKIEKLRNAAADLILAAAERLAQTGTIGLSNAFLGLAVAMAATPVGWIVAGLAAIAAVIGVGLVIYNNYKQAINSASIELENQKEVLSNLKSAYNDVKEEVENLTDALDNFQDAYDNLNELKKGTDEWNEALEESNNQLYGLIQNYPKLAQFMETDENGVNYIDTESQGYQDYLASEKNKLKAAQSAVLSQQATVYNQESIVALQKFNNKNSGLSQKLFEISDIKDNSLEELLGQALGSDKYTRYEDKQYELSTEEQSLVQSLTSLKSSVDANTKSADANTSAAEDAAASYGIYSSGDIKDSDLNYFSNSQKTKLDVKDETVKKAIMSTYEEKLGDEITDIARNGANIEITYKDDEGKSQTKTVTDKAALNAGVEEVLQGYADVAASSEAAKTVFEELGASVKTTSDGTIESISFLGQNITSLSDIISSETTDKETKEKASALQMYEDNTNGLADLLKDYGINSIQDFSNALKNSSWAVEDFAKTLEQVSSETASTTNLYGNKITNRLGLSNDEDYMSDVLEDTDLDTQSFNRLAADSNDEYRKTKTNYLNTQKNQIETQLNSTEDEDKQKEYRKNLANVNEQLANVETETKDVTAAQIKAGKAVTNLQDNYDDLNAKLNESNKGTLSYYEALGKLDEAFSDILNIDVGTLSNEFLESAKAADYFQRIVQGDLTAINELRQSAAIDIIQHFQVVNIDDDDLNNLRNQLQSEIENLDIPNLKVGTSVDNSGFIEHLNQLLRDSQITAEQATNILSSIGMEGTITTEEVEGYTNAIEYEFTKVEGEVDSAGNRISSSMRLIPHVTKIPTTMSVPVIKGATYTGSGVSTISSGLSGASSSSSGSSGGSSGSSKNNKNKDNAKNEWDYLTDITNDLERASAITEKLSNLSDRLYGKDKIDNLAELRESYRDYLRLLEEELELEKNHANLQVWSDTDENGNYTLAHYINAAGVGVTYDENGNVDNGKQIREALVAQENAAIANYNAHKDDDDTTAYEDAITDIENLISGFDDAFSDYEETLSNIEDTESEIQSYVENIQDNTDEIIDSVLEGLDEMKEAFSTFNDFMESYDNWFGGGTLEERIANSITSANRNLDSYLSNTIDLDEDGTNDTNIIDENLNNLISRIQDFEDVLYNGSTKISEEQAFDNLSEATNNVTGDLKALQDEYDKYTDAIDEAIDGINDFIDNRQEKYDNTEDYINTRLDQVKLLYGDESYNSQIGLMQAQQSVYSGRIATDKAAIAAQQAIVTTLESIQTTYGSLSEDQQEQLEKAQDAITGYQSDILDVESKSLENLQAIKKAQVNSSVNKYTNDLFGGYDVDWLESQWELATQTSEQYYDDYNKAFEIQKFQLKYQDLLNDTEATSLATQQKISSQMNQQLEYLRTKTNLSEYDVKYAEAQLEILQKQIALEDAQANKSQMRLQRNSAGNYDFVYAADEDTVNEAESSLVEARQEAYNLSKDAYLDTYQNALSAAQKAKEMIVEISTDASLSTEQQAERIQYILDNLKEYLDGASGELGEIATNLYNDVTNAENLIAEENLGNLAQTFQNMKDQSYSLLEDIDDRFSLTVTANLQNADTINAKTDTLFNELTGYLDDYSLNTERTLEECGDTWDSFAEDSINKAVESTNDLNDGMDTFLEKISIMQSEIANAASQIKGYGSAISDAMTEAKSYIAYAKQLEQEEASKKIATAKNQEDEGATVAGSSQSDLYAQTIENGRYTATNSGANFGWATNYKITDDDQNIYFGNEGIFNTSGEQIRDVLTLADGIAGNIIIGYLNHKDEPFYWSGMNEEEVMEYLTSQYGETISDLVHGIVWMFTDGWTRPAKANEMYSLAYWDEHLSDGYYYKFTKDNGFDTGGYTGTWADGGIDNKNGKIAVLHQKELVLNADDTQNILDAVNIMRTLSMPNVLSSLGSLVPNTNSDIIEQRVEINATFPGVTEAIEIKQALEQLADNAYQLAASY